MPTTPSAGARRHRRALVCLRGAGRRGRCSTTAATSPSPSTRSTARPTSTSTSRSARSSRFYPAGRRRRRQPPSPPGRQQLAAGFFIYGPQTALVADARRRRRMLRPRPRARAPSGSAARAARDPAALERIRHQRLELPALGRRPSAPYIDDCLEGAEGPREQDFNMRWIASLVAEAYRILVRGGVFLYPARPAAGLRPRAGCAWSTRRNPIAFLIEQAGGARHRRRSTASSTSCRRACTSACRSSSARPRRSTASPRYHTDPRRIAERSPLFGNRGLFRA